jgi:hypothetical protein
MKILMDVLAICQRSKRKNNYVLANFMRVFMVSYERLFIPQLIQKNPYFKSWVVGCLKDGFKTLVGHISMHIFKKLVD